MLRLAARTRRPAPASPTGPRPLASVGVGGHGAVSGARPALNLQRASFRLSFYTFLLELTVLSQGNISAGENRILHLKTVERNVGNGAGIIGIDQPIDSLTLAPIAH